MYHSIDQHTNNPQHYQTSNWIFL